MKVLVGCEESQIVTKAFRALGHEAYSCDILPTSGANPEWHFQCDVRDLLSEYWDALIAFPDCTHLSAAGAPKWKVKQADGRQQQAIDFVIELWNTDIDKISLENPTGILSTVWRKPDQIINPFQFGEPFKKRTCLWLKNLPKLQPTCIVEPEYHYTSNSYHGGLLKDGSRRKSKLPIYKAWDSAKERSRSFAGVAAAMAAQWGGDIREHRPEREIIFDCQLSEMPPSAG